MPTDVIMPALGMAQETGKVVRWHKSEGETVAKGEPLMEVETDKVPVDVEAPADGTLAAVTASEGADVPVGQTIALILAAGESAPAMRASEPWAPGPRAGPVASNSLLLAPPTERSGGNGRRRPLAS